MRNGIVHHKSDRKSCVLPTADRNKFINGIDIKIIVSSFGVGNAPSPQPWPQVDGDLCNYHMLTYNKEDVGQICVHI